MNGELEWISQNHAQFWTIIIIIIITLTALIIFVHLFILFLGGVLIFLMQYKICFLGEMEPAHPDRFCEIHSTYYVSFAWQHLNTSDDQDLTIRMEWSYWHNIHPKWTASFFNTSFYDSYGPIRTVSTDITDPDSQQSHRNSKSMSKHILKIEITCFPK